MIIEAKGTRQAAEPVDPSKQLDFNKPERFTRLPLFVAMVITGAALFLRSAFGAQSPRDGQPEDEASSPSSPMHRGRPHNGPPQVDDITTGSVDEEEPTNKLRHRTPDWEDDFTVIDATSFSYSARSFADLGSQVTAFFPAAFHYQPQNDNAPQDAPPRKAAQADRGGATASPAARPSDDVKLIPDNDVDAPEEDDDDETPPTSGNRAPVVSGPVRLHDVFAGQVMLVGLSQLLFGATDPDGDILSINDLTATGGTLTQLTSGWSLATLPGELGLVTFTYQISDGLLSIVQTASFNIIRNVVTLTPLGDTFAGTPYDDDIDGLAGDDIIDARAGNDIVVGGLGNDHIMGGDGDDHLQGGAGDDVIFGGAGDDVIGGGAGDDRLFGEEGNDIIDGDDGDDFIMGGAGNDIVNGGEGNDELQGNEDDDILAGGAGDDLIDGGEGNDILEGDAGADVLIGGAGDDIVRGGDDDDIIMGGAGHDDIDGGNGFDTIDYSAFFASFHFDFDAGRATSEETGEDRFTNIEAIKGGQGQDTFVLGAKAAVLAGRGGSDLFVFTVTDDKPALSHQLVFEILDFVVGDRIHLANYEISHRAERLEEERFSDVYDALDDGFEANLPIRVTHAFYDDINHTIIEADLDRNDFYEVSITLDGVELPLTIGNYVA